MTTNLLLVEDDQALQKVLENFLHDEGFNTQVASTGSEALLKVDATLPDLVLLDLGLPDIQGETVLQRIRQKYPNLPIIVLTAKSKPNEVAAGLNLGADDYLPKPFAAEELLARINARLKRDEPKKDRLEFDDFVLDFARMTAHRSNKEINLTKTEFDLLEFLVKNRGRVMNRSTILNHVWGFSPNIESRVVDIYIGYLRKKIDQDFSKKLIHNKRGFGYYMDLS